MLLGCCDGAATNRRFISTHASKENPGRTLNAYGNWPLFFLSDPTHLVKKLRNNLMKSGYSDTSKRLLKPGQDVALWRHIRDAYDRDKVRPLHFTPLREEHVNLTSLSLMRSRLAYDVFSERVEMELQDEQASGTLGTQQYLKRARCIINLFCSKQKLCSKSDKLIEDLFSMKKWFDEWHSSCAANPKSFVSMQVYEDIKVTTDGMHGLLDFIANNERVSCIQ